MKVKLSLLFVFILIAGVNASSALAALDPLPASRSPFNQRDRFQTDLFSGGATYSYPIRVPKGTNDLTPEVFLSYNSAGARDFKAYAGVGWLLNQDYIERDVNYSPGSSSDDKFKLHFKGGVYDLVYVSSESRYHTKIESNLHITKIASGGSNDYSEYWQVITTDGTKYRFGYQSQSELVCNGRSYVGSWNLDQVTDVHDNKIYYIYTESNGASYLSQIKYNNDQKRIIDFTYGSASYQRQLYIQGCNVTEASRLSNIQVKIETNLVRQYDFSYSTAGNNQSLLQSITEKGSDGSSLSATTFDYKSEIKTLSTSPETWINSAAIDVHLEKTDVVMADANGDGLLDIIKSEGNGTNTWKVWLNTGSGWNTTHETWINNAAIDAKLDRTDTAFMDVTGDGLPDIIKTDSNAVWKVFRNTGRSWETTAETWADFTVGEVNLETSRVGLVDVTGDGLPDVIRTWWNAQQEWEVYKNTGSSWNTSAEVWSYNGIGQGLDDAKVRVIDVNGDGLADIIRATASGTNDTWNVWKNTGSSWNLSSETWINNANVDAHLEMTNVALWDANGDGLVDIVKSDDNGSADTWKVLQNLGGSWSTSWETWIGPSSSVDLSLQANTQMADVSGDGLPDVIRTSYSGSNDTWQVWKNNGLAPDLLATVHTAQGGAVSFNYNQAALETTGTISSASYSGEYFNNQNLSGSPTVTRTDSTLNFDWGSGSPDGSISANGFSARWTQTRSYDAGTYIFTTRSDDGVRLYVDGELLIDKWTDHGATYYTASKALSDGNHTVVMEYYENTGDAVAKLTYQRIGLPFPLWQVSQMTVNNGLGNSQQTNDVTTYSYKNAFYKFEDKEFRGFGEVNTVEPNGSKKKYVFNQDNALKGLVAEIQHRDSASNPFAETENTWGSSVSSGVTTVTLNTEKQYTYDGTASNPKVIETNYQYDSYGNVTKKSEKGDNSINTDDRFIYFEYVYNTTDWIVNTAKKTYRNASDDTTKVSETSFYYDGHTSLTDAPTDGDVTKEVKWLSGGTNPETEYTYDSYGNQTSVIDDNNHTTATAYDTTGTYPISTTNAKNQTTTVSYDLGTGNLLSTTDPNSQTTTYTYDVFGRLLKEIKPYDNSTYPTTLYTYYADGAAPEGVLVEKRNTSSNSATLDLYTWHDGLGRKIQTRADAEDTSKQIVLDTYYASNGAVLKQTVPHLETLSSVYATPSGGLSNTLMSYDNLGRLTSVINPDSTTKTLAYDHWKVTKTDEKSHVKREFMNAFGKIIKVEEVNGASTYTTTYTYNSRDDLTKITDHENNEFTFTFDTLSRKTAQTDPDMGTWSYVYDGVGNLTSQTDNRSITTTKTYDELNRVTLVNYPTDTDNSFLYDSGKIGTLSIATDSAGTVFYTYDNRLRKTQEQRVINGTSKTTQFSYDAADRISSQTNPDGEVVSYTFNAQGEINSASGSASLLSNIDYNSLGKITAKAFGNGLTTNYTYNTNDFRLNRIQTSSLQDLNYTYDAVGNVANIEDDITSKTQLFTYDDLDRLKTASESAGGYNHEYQYNAIGNLTAFTNAGIATTYGYGANAKPHAIAVATESAALRAATISDDWASGSISSEKWNNWGSPQTSVVFGTLRITSTLAGGYYGISSKTASPRDVTGSSVTNQLVNAGNQSLTSWGVYPVVIGTTAGNNQVYWAVEGNNIRAYKNVSGTFTIVQQTSYNSSVHKYFRVRESAGTIYWDYSTDGISWTNFTSTANPFVVTSVTVGFNVGTWQAEGSTTTAIFDNFNISALAPATSTFTDKWSSGSINNSKWNNWGYPQTSIVSGQLVITSTLGGGYYGVGSDTSGDLNLTGSFVSNQLVNAGNQSITSWSASPVVVTKSGASTYSVYWAVEGNKIRAYKQVAGSYTNIQETTYNSTTHKYFRIRESEGTIYWDYSTDGSSWTNFTSQTAPFEVTKVIVGTSVGTWQAESSTTSATFDNFTVSYPKTKTIADGWNKGYIDPGVWSNWGGAQVTINSQQVKMDSTTASGYYGMNTNGSGFTYDLTNSYVINQLVNAGNQSLTSLEAYPLYVNASWDDTNAYFWLVTGNTIKAYKKVSGTSTQLASTSYNTTNHKWFRIREVSGTIYFDTSADGGTWNTLTSTANAFDVTSMVAVQMIGTWQAEASATTIYFDNFNVIPEVYVYDANGNMTSDGTKCYEYNDANQMKKVTDCANTQSIAEYIYDYTGQRMVKKNYSDGTLKNTVISWSDAFETNAKVGGSTDTTVYYFVNNELIAKKNPDGSRYYMHTDHLGSTNVVTNSAGSLVETTSYGPWGEVLVGGTTSKFLYTGQESDSETGLHYYGSRYYDSYIRRFIQPDALIWDAYNPQSLNRYTYVNNNPILYTDPTGHNPAAVLGVLIANPITAAIVGGSIVGYFTVPEFRNLVNSTVASAAKSVTQVVQSTSSTLFNKGDPAKPANPPSSNQSKTNTTNQGKSSTPGGTQGGGGPQLPNPFNNPSPYIPPIAYDTWQKIQENGLKPLEGFRSGVYQNITKPLLPKVAEFGRYMEHDVKPFVEGVNRGAQRLVIDTFSGQAWFTPDHYKSFIEIK